MNLILVTIHNITRWVVIILGVFAIIRGIAGLIGKKTWQESDRKIGFFFTLAFDIQILFGILLYFFFSQWGLKSILNFGMAEVMKVTVFRFYVVEHALMMFLGIIFAHLGSILPKKTENSGKKFKRVVIFFGLALILILVGVPWDRPLFPGL